MILSASKMKRWMACPLQVKLSKEFDVEEKQFAKTSFGTVIHSALELYNTQGFNLDDAKSHFIECWDNPEILDLPSVDSWIFGRGSNYGSLRERGLQILEEYDEKQKWESRIVIAAEHYFIVPFGDHYLNGYVDLIEIKQSANGKPVVRIVDFKSTSKQPTINDLNYDVQFTAYVYASLQEEFWIGNPEFDVKGLDNGEELFYNYKKYPRRAIWYHLWGNKEIDAGSRDDGDFMRLYRCACAIDEAEKQKIYVPNISADSCGYCDYIDHCHVMIPVKEKLNKPIEQEKEFF